MSTSGDNPFSSPEGNDGPSYEAPNFEGGGSVIPRSSVDYMEPVGKVFQNPNWFVNILLVGICFIIPIIGGMVAFGYLAEVIASQAYGRSQSYPDFDFNRFVEYLTRGFWMFLVGFVVWVCIFPIIMIAGFIMAAMQATDNDALAIVGGLVYFGTNIFVNVLSFFIIMPLIIRAGMLNDFAAAFDFRWIKDFISKMWVEQLLGGIILYIFAFLIMLVGCIALCIGYIPAAGAVLIMWGLFLAQLYQVFVHRGGQPLPFKEATKL